MVENFDKLRGQRKFARQSFWSKLGLGISSNKENVSKKPKKTRDSDNAERKARMKEMRKQEIEILEEELKKETTKSKGVPSVKMMNLNRQVQVLKAYNEAVDGFGEKYKTLGDAKRAVKERRNRERELYFKNEVFEEKYKFFLRIQDLQKALRDFEETAGRVFLDLRYNGNSESEKFYEELRVEIGKIETELQTLEIDNPLEFRSAYLLSLQEDLKKEGHIAKVKSVQEYLEQIKIRMTIGKPIFLHGPTGTGKTSLARFASKELTGKNPEIVYCNPQTRESNIYGRTGISVEDGASKTFFDFGPLARAMQNGSVCIFDEFTALPKDQMSMIKGIMNAKVGDTVSIPGDGSIKIQTGFQLIFTANLKTEKNLERNDLPPEVANEFAQNNLEISYTKPEEAFDIFLSRIINEKGEAEFSRYDLEETVPNLLKAMKDIQDGYNGIMSQEVAELSGVGDLGKVKILKKLVMNQRTIENILEGWKVVRKKDKDIAFVEFLDDRCATELNFGEYKDDKLFVAKILASRGLLRTLDPKEELGIPEADLAVSNWNRINVQDARASLQVETLNIKQLSELDPFEIKKAKATHKIDDVLNEVNSSDAENGNFAKMEILMGQKTEDQMNAERDFLIQVAIKDWSQTYPTKPVEEFTLNTFDYKSKITSDQAKTGEVTHLNQPTPKDLESLFKEVKPEIFNPNTDQSFIQWRDMERIKTKKTGITKKYELAEYTAKVLSKKYYIPGLDYWKWVQENPTNPNLEQIKDGNWHYTPSSLFRKTHGHCSVPRVGWDGSEFIADGLWLGSDILSDNRVLLFPLPEASSKSKLALAAERDFLIQVAIKDWSQTYPTKPVEEFTLNTFDYKSKITADQSKVGEVTHLNQPTPKDLESLFKKVKPEIFDPITDQGFIQWRDKERIKTGVNVTGATEMHEFAEYTAKVLSKKYYIPGLDYWKWVQENPTNPNLANIKDRNWYYTPSSLFRNTHGRCNVPKVFWNGSDFRLDGSRLSNYVLLQERVLLLPRS